MTLIPEILPYHGSSSWVPSAGVSECPDLRASVAAKADNAEAAKALIKFVTGPTAAPTFKAKGMEAH